MTIEEFKKVKIQYMKDGNKDAVNALNLVINKIMLASIEKKAVGETLSEGDIDNIVQKSEKELIEECDGYEKANRVDSVAQIKNQIETVRKFLPQMMSDADIVKVLNSLEDKSMPSVMKYFKTNFNGKCDMKKVGQLLNSCK